MGKKGGGAMNTDVAGAMRQQEEMLNRQMQMQQQYQREAEERMRVERERERQNEYLRRQEAASKKEESLVKQERQEAAVFREMTGQSKEDTSDFGGGFNLAMPTIERPDYEREDRPI
jgi:predicted Holliday junction resolvase-like endonuclease